ncbi:transposase, partial [Embleya sp. NPDC059267]
MIETGDIGVFLGLDVGRGEHHATAVTPAGTKAFDKRLPNSEPKLRELFAKLKAKHGTVLVVVDQPASIGALPLAVARDEGCKVAYLPGLTMRRIADLYPGEAKTDARDAFVIADAARALPHTLRAIEPADEAVAEPEMIVGFDDDLAAACAERFTEHEDAEIVTGFPGLGDLTGARILAEIGDDRSRFADGRALKAYAGSAPITRASGKSLIVHHRKVKNQRLAALGYVWSFAAPTGSREARGHYDRRRTIGDRHTAA